MFPITLVCIRKKILPDIRQKLNLSISGKMLKAGVIIDPLLIVTTLTIGILGIANIMPGIPLGVSSVLIGVGGLIALPWMILLVKKSYRNSVTTTIKLIFSNYSSSPS